MSKNQKRSALVVKDLHAISSSRSKYVTVLIDRWHYHIKKGKLTLLEGFYSSDEELEKAEQKCRAYDNAVKRGASLKTKCPRHFVLTVSWADLVRMTEAILSLRDESEKLQNK